jgi:hypothetical protein
MTSFKQIEANRSNARKSTGPITEEGKQRSRCNAVRHGLTAETVIGSLEDAEDYKAFEANVIADYDAQSTVERELVLRLASLLWRLRRATAMETGLFDIQAEHLREFRHVRNVHPSVLDQNNSVYGSDVAANTGLQSFPTADPGGPTPSAPDIARCFVRLGNLPNYPLDRLSRYEALLWRHAAQILIALDALDRRKPQERGRRASFISRLTLGHAF